MFFLMNAATAVVQKVFVINGTVISNHDIAQINKIYKMLRGMHMPVLDGDKPERYFYRKVFLSHMKKLMQGDMFKISDDELKNYINFQLMQLNISREQLEEILKQNKISVESFDEYFSDTLQWFRYVAMNYSGLARPSEKAIKDFQKKIDEQMRHAPSTFLDGYIVQVPKSQEPIVEELKINAMTRAHNEKEFLQSAGHYEKQTLTQVPLEAVSHPVIKQALTQAYETKKAVVCPVEENMSLVVYVSNVKVIKREVTKEQAAQMLSNEMITGKYSKIATDNAKKKMRINYADKNKNSRG